MTTGNRNCLGKFKLNNKRSISIRIRSVPSFKHRKHDHVWADRVPTAPAYSIDNNVSYRQLFLPFYNN